MFRAAAVVRLVCCAVLLAKLITSIIQMLIPKSRRLSPNQSKSYPNSAPHHTKPSFPTPYHENVINAGFNTIGNSK